MYHNILVLHRGGDQLRGTEACVVALLRRMTGLKPFVLCNREVHLQAFRQCGAEAALFDFPEIMLDGRDVRLPFKQYIFALWRLNRIVKQRKISLMYCSGGLPCQIAVPVAKFRGIPTLCHFHHPAPKRYYYLWLVKSADRLIFPSTYTRDYTRRKANVDGIVINDGIDCTSEFVPVSRRNSDIRSRHRIEERDVVIAQVGAFSANKRHDILIAAFEKAQRQKENLKLLLIGDGPNRQKMERTALRLGLDTKVIFTGYVPSVAEYLQNVVDINVLASTEEGLGIVLLQGSACGIPNIGTDCTGIREAIRDTETGYLFKGGDVDGLAGMILNLSESPNVRRRMGEAGRRFVEENFSEGQYAERIMKEMKELLGAG